MAQPTTRDEFKHYILRKLGMGVIEQINVTNEQLDDRIDEALKYFWDYHFDGSEKEYYKYQVLAADITNKYITLPENIIGAVRIFDMNPSLSVSNMWSVRYQIALNDLYTLTNTSIAPFYGSMTYLSLIEDILVGQKPIRYNRHTNRLYIDMDWSIVLEGTYIIVEAYKIVDPETYVDVWKDMWLQRYATALVKKQWADNLSKFKNVVLPGGLVLNAEGIHADAEKEIEKLEYDAVHNWSLPVSDMIG